MKLDFKAPALIVAAGISLTAMGAASQSVNLSEAKVAQIRATLAQAKLVEAPYRAAHVVMAASKSERSAVTRAVVEEVLAAHPTAVSATVRAILTVAPDEVAAVMEGVMEKTPKAYAVALAVVGDLNPGMMPQATGVVALKAPAETANLQAFSVSGTTAEFSPPRPLPKRSFTATQTLNTVVQKKPVKQNNSCLLAP